MQPTVGRVVYYQEPGMSDQPCCALIVYVWPDGTVNLVAFGRNGDSRVAISVPRGAGPCQWDWMPYQKQKATAGDHNSQSAEPRPR